MEENEIWKKKLKKKHHLQDLALLYSGYISLSMKLRNAKLFRLFFFFFFLSLNYDYYWVCYIWWEKKEIIFHGRLYFLFVGLCFRIQLYDEIRESRLCVEMPHGLIFSLKYLYAHVYSNLLALIIALG